MELISENVLTVSIVLTIAGIVFAAFIASPYEIYFEDTDETDDI